MAGLGNNLYPPMVETYMPAFLINEGRCRIYFSLSRYNSSKDIQNVQVIASNLNNNRTALSYSKWPAEVMIASLNVDYSIKNDYKYYVTINSDDLEGNQFILNEIYKIQLRFTSVAAETAPSGGQIATWLASNQQYFSEWSTQCLISGISTPKLNLFDFDVAEGEDLILSSELTGVVGTLEFEDPSDKETLKNYNITIKEKNGETVYTSGDLYPIAANEINHILECRLVDAVSYLLIVDYTTKGGYQGSESFSFSIIQTNIEKMEVTLEAEMDRENGRVKVSVISSSGEIFLGNFTIRRASSKTNFTVWEDVKTVAYTDGSPLNYIWYDHTVESGVWYRYAIQKRNSYGGRGITTYTKRDLLADFEDIFLVAEGVQLCVKFNPGIGSYKRVIHESRTDTVGSKYAYFKRNGAVEYQQFSISGLITSYSDESGIFSTRGETYKENIDRYNRYNETNQIDDHYDYFYEREFRRKVEDFLYKNNVKLFRSLTEGNFLVKLMDISLSPVESLGRMLYSFNASAYEIDECSIDNYQKYGVLGDRMAVGTYSPDIRSERDVIGQLIATVSASTNIQALVQEKHENSSLGEYVSEIEYFKWVRITFDGVPSVFNDNLEPDENGTLAGYVVIIDGNRIFVPASSGYYELLDDDTYIENISFPIDTAVTLDYMAHISMREREPKQVHKVSYSVKVGQLSGVFEYYENLFNLIISKYYIDTDIDFQHVTSINGVTFELEPNSVVYVQDSFDSKPQRHLIGETGVLHLREEGTTITNLYAAGIHLYDQVVSNKDLKYKYYEIEGEIESIEGVETPVINGVYTLASGEKYIYFRGEWFQFDYENKDVQCSIEGLIDYEFEQAKGEYVNES